MSTVTKHLPRVIVGMITLIVLASCDEPFVRDNPFDPGAEAYQPRFSATVSHLEAEWIRIDWEDLPGSTGFVVERSLDGGEYEEIARLEGMVSSYADSTEVAGTYRYRVTRETLSGRTVTVTTGSLYLGHWLPAGSRPFPANDIEEAVTLRDGRVLIVRPNGSVETSDGLILDPATLNWTVVSPIPLSSITSITVLDDGRVLALGGYGGYAHLWPQMGMVIFDPETLNWTELPEPPYPPADIYAPVAFYHIDGTKVLLSFQAVHTPHPAIPRRHTRVETVAYIFDIKTEEYRPIEAPPIGGTVALASMTGVVRASDHEIRAFVGIECSDTVLDPCSGGSYALTYDILAEEWTMRASAIADHLLPLSDYRYIQRGDSFTFLVDDGPTLRVRTIGDGTVVNYHIMDNGYVIGGDQILVVERDPVRIRRYAGPSRSVSVGTTTLMISGNRLMAANRYASGVWVSRPIDDLPEIPL